MFPPRLACKSAAAVAATAAQSPPASQPQMSRKIVEERRRLRLGLGSEGSDSAKDGNVAISSGGALPQAAT